MMKNRVAHLFSFWAAWSAAGCAMLRGPDLVRQGAVCVKREHAGPGSLRSVWVTQEGASLLVQGSIDGGAPVPDHVRVTLIGPDGERLAEGTESVHRGGGGTSGPRHQRRHRTPGRRFSVTLPAVAPEGSTLRIAY